MNLKALLKIKKGISNESFFQAIYKAIISRRRRIHKSDQSISVKSKSFYNLRSFYRRTTLSFYSKLEVGAYICIHHKALTLSSVQNLVIFIIAFLYKLCLFSQDWMLSK